MVRKYLVLVSLVFAVIFSACASKKAKNTVDNLAPQDSKSKDAEELTPVDKDSLTAEEMEQLKKLLASLEDIPFDFDSYAIPESGRAIVKQNADILNRMLAKRGKYIKITLEGHTDERGSADYNLALGDRRAKTVKDYLLIVGFTDKQLRIISYGKERPKVDESTMEAWAANRRVHIAVE